MAIAMDPTQRFGEWVSGSHAIGGPEQRKAFLAASIQGLGLLDCQLIQNEAYCWDQNQNGEQSLMDLNNHLTLSYLWVLGSYEWLRTLDQGVRDKEFLHFGGLLAVRIRETKEAFERLRIPLAKLEAPKRNPKDNPIAYPARHPENGVAWLITDTDAVTRLDLSNSALGLLGELRASRLA